MSTPINLNDIREKIALFIVEQILDENGEFHYHEEVPKKGDKAQMETNNSCVGTLRCS